MAATIGSGHKVLERWVVRKTQDSVTPSVEFLWTIHKDEALEQIAALDYQTTFQGAGPLYLLSASAQNTQKGNAATLQAIYGPNPGSTMRPDEPRAEDDPPHYSEQGGEEEVSIVAVAPYKDMVEAELKYAAAKLQGTEDDVPVPAEPSAEFTEVIALIDAGILTKTMQRRTWVELSVREQGLGGADYAKVGKISRPPGNPYTRPTHNWRQQAPSAEQVMGVDRLGQPVTLWRITRSWEESDESGWNPVMYT